MHLNSNMPSGKRTASRSKAEELVAENNDEMFGNSSTKSKAHTQTGGNHDGNGGAMHDSGKQSGESNEQPSDSNTPPITLSDLYALMVRNHREVSTQLNDFSNKISEITSKVESLETAVEFAQQKTIDNETEIHKLTDSINKKDSTINTLQNTIQSLNARVHQVEQNMNRHERRSREWGLRIFGVTEHENENTRDILCNILLKLNAEGINNYEEASKVIEYCHRLGPKQQYAPNANRPRPIIANLIFLLASH